MNSETKYRSSSVYRRVLGFTMVEVLVALVLGLLLGTGVLQLFIGSKRTYGFQDAASRLQENGRFALNLVADGLRSAGFTGCSTRDPNYRFVNVLNNGTVVWWEDFDKNAVRGYDGAVDFGGTSIDTTAGSRAASTDAVISLGGSGGMYAVSGATATTFSLNTIRRPSGSSLAAGDIALVCDSYNQKVALFQVTKVTPGVPNVIEFAAGTNPAPGNSSAGLNNTAKDKNGYVVNRTTVTDYFPTAFFVGISSDGPTKPNSLYQSTPTAANGTGAQELVEGIQDMQLCYGVDTSTKKTEPVDGVADVYQSATDITTADNWSKVVSVRINLLVTSLEDNVLIQPQTYTFVRAPGRANTDCGTMGRSVTATDKRLYQTFSTTVGIRSRLP